jgi:hypothetical protein
MDVPVEMPLNMSAKERITSRSVIEDRGFTSPCWISTRSGNGDGYTKLTFEGKLYSTHRFAYETLVGPIPDGLVPDHLCRQRACCNPSHLELITRRENVLRGDGPAARNATKTRCPRGHALTGDNLIPANLRQGSRACLTCHRDRRDARRANR